MAIQSASNAHMASLQQILGQVSKATALTGEAGQTISGQESESIINAVKGLPPASQTQAATAIQALVADGFLSLTDASQTAFAKAFNIPAQELTPRQTASLAGLQPATTAFGIAMGAVAKTPKMNRQTMANLVSKAEALLPKEGQQFLAAVLKNAARDGTLQMDSNARKAFVKWMGGLDQEKNVTERAEVFDAKPSGNVSAFAQLMASGACFEDLLAAFMFHVIGQIEKETKDKMEEYAQSIDREQGQTNQAGSMQNTSKLMESLGLDDKQDVTLTPEQIKATKKSLEAVVNSAHAHATDDGLIDSTEATKIAEKLGRLDYPVDALVANAILNNMRRSGLDLNGPLKPVIDWAVSKLSSDGKTPDLSPLPPIQDPSNPDDPVVAQLRSSPKLEDKIASYLVEVFSAGHSKENSNTQLKDKMKGLKALEKDMLANPVAQKALNESAAASPSPTTEAATPAQAESAATTGPQKSRQQLFEELKTLQQELGQILQAVSNILNTMHQNAMNSIRAIR